MVTGEDSVIQTNLGGGWPNVLDPNELLRKFDISATVNTSRQYQGQYALSLPCFAPRSTTKEVKAVVEGGKEK